MLHVLSFVQHFDKFIFVLSLFDKKYQVICGMETFTKPPFTIDGYENEEAVKSCHVSLRKQ
jgi:hypothetical protein